MLSIRVAEPVFRLYLVGKLFFVIKSCKYKCSQGKYYNRVFSFIFKRSMLKSPAIYIDRFFFCNNVKVSAKSAEKLLQLETMTMGHL